MCSTIIFGSGLRKYLAQNYDYSLDHGLVAVGLRGTLKENGRQPGERAIRWCVQYGSITFNQVSLELPVSGMNEKGLAVALMRHDDGDFGNDHRYARLNPLQWIQYQLDNYQSVAEVCDGLKSIRPRNEGMPLHYALLDASGQSMLVEFVGGEPRLQVNPDVPILTNSTYQRCLENARDQAAARECADGSSLARFARLYGHYVNHDGREAGPSTGFAWLESVRQAPSANPASFRNAGPHNDTITAWSTVFCPAEMTIYLRSHHNESTRTIRLADFEFGKESEYMVMGVHDGQEGSASSFFAAYAREHNRALVQRSGEALRMPVAEQEMLVALIDRLYRTRKLELG